MENASKALIIAGGVLIAIIILSIMAYMFSNIEIFGTQYSKTLNDQATEEFNTKFNVYENRELNIYDVITLYNLAKENNIQIITPRNLLAADNIHLKEKNKLMSEDIINKRYNCKITYNDGKVNYIIITETKI